jgi:hypothetical protein
MHPHAAVVVARQRVCVCVVTHLPSRPVGCRIGPAACGLRVGHEMLQATPSIAYSACTQTGTHTLPHTHRSVLLHLSATASTKAPREPTALFARFKRRRFLLKNSDMPGETRAIGHLLLGHAEVAQGGRMAVSRAWIDTSVYMYA